MTSFYSGESITMERLGHFLEATYGKPLVMCCDDLDDAIAEYEEFEEPTDADA